MARPRLFVRSKKADIVSGSTHGSYYTSQFSLKKTEFSLLPHDSQAKDLLTKNGIRFDLVDLSKGMKAGLVAKLRRIKETPTLEVEQSSVRRYVGLKAISGYVSEVRTQTQD